jgi:hypothetical protein
MRSHLVMLVLAVGACAEPVAEDPHTVLREVAARYPAFFPDGGGLVHPRFGDPAIVRRGDAVSIELLRHDGEPAPRAALVDMHAAGVDARACAAGGAAVAGCWPLALVETGRDRIDARTSHVRFAATGAAPSGGYDLVVDGARARRCVWLRDDDPAAPRPLHVVQLSDLHVGKNPSTMGPHLAQVIHDVNALAPDLVVVTGDLVQNGENVAQAGSAAAILGALDAPVLTVMGGHDVGRSLGARARRGYGTGWESDARAFHPYLFVSLGLGGWQFVGFDTGPASGLGTRVVDRGVGPATIAQLNTALADAWRDGRRGVVLASHAPTRSSLFGGPSHGRGTVGQMDHGGDAIEAMLLDAGASGRRVLHLAGHTHWSDVFESQASTRGPRFERWPALSPCPRVVTGDAALVTTQSASEAGFFAKTSGHGYGFAELWLDDTVRVAHHRYGASPQLQTCERGSPR